jgi:hypothetical protein
VVGEVSTTAIMQNDDFQSPPFLEIAAKFHGPVPDLSGNLL